MKTSCLFYGTVAEIASNKRRNDVFLVRTLDFQSSIRYFSKRELRNGAKMC